MATQSGRNVLSIDRIRPAYEQVSVRLRDLISSGELKPGERLPNEAELARSFGVSRTTIREALRVLTSEGLVETSRGTSGGTFVKRVDVSHLSAFLRNQISVLVGTDSMGIADIVDARMALELPAARWAAERRTEDHLAELERLCERPLDVTAATEVLHDRMEFHGALLVAAQSSLISALAHSVFDVLTDQVQKVGLPAPIGRSTDEAHHAILDAVRARDAEGAATAMEEHLTEIALAWRDYYSAEAALAGAAAAARAAKTTGPKRRTRS